MKENRDFKGVWIPKEVWLNTDLSIIEKVLLVEIDSLDNSDRGCFASNEYLAKFVQLSESRVAHIISDLKKRQYIVVVFTDGRNRGLKLHPQQSRFAKNSKAESLKTTNMYSLFLKSLIMCATLLSDNCTNFAKYSFDAKHPRSELSRESISTNNTFSIIDKSVFNQISFGIQTPLKSLFSFIYKKVKPSRWRLLGS